MEHCSSHSTVSFPTFFMSQKLCRVVTGDFFMMTEEAGIAGSCFDELGFCLVHDLFLFRV